MRNTYFEEQLVRCSSTHSLVFDENSVAIDVEIIRISSDKDHIRNDDGNIKGHLQDRVHFLK